MIGKKKQALHESTKNFLSYEWKSTVKFQFDLLKTIKDISSNKGAAQLICDSSFMIEIDLNYGKSTCVPPGTSTYSPATLSQMDIALGL